MNTPKKSDSDWDMKSLTGENEVLESSFVKNATLEFYDYNCFNHPRSAESFSFHPEKGHALMKKKTIEKWHICAI